MMKSQHRLQAHENGTNRMTLRELENSSNRMRAKILKSPNDNNSTTCKEPTDL